MEEDVAQVARRSLLERLRGIPMSAKMVTFGAGYLSLVLLASTLFYPALESSLTGERAGGVPENVDLGPSDQLPETPGEVSRVDDNSGEAETEPPAMSIEEIRSQQVKLGIGQRVLVAPGTSPQLSWTGDGYSLVFSDDGLFISHSNDGVLWSEPILVDEWNGRENAGWGAKGSLLRRRDGTYFLLFAKPYPAAPEVPWYQWDVRFFCRTSADGYNWSSPELIYVNPSKIQLPIYGISAVETSDGNIVVAFTHDTSSGGGLSTMSTANLSVWEGYHRRKSTKYNPTGITISELNRSLRIAYSDHDVIYFGTWDGRIWKVVRATPNDLFSSYWWASMTHMANGRTLIAFDHLDQVFVSSSLDLANWTYPVLAVRQASMPSVAPVGYDTVMVAFSSESGVSATLLNTSSMLSTSGSTAGEDGEVADEGEEGPHYDLRPAIWGDLVVWETDRHCDQENEDNSEIYMLNLTAGDEVRLTESPSTSRNAHVYEDKVVWCEATYDFDTLQGSDIFLMDLETGLQSQLASDPFQDNPVIFNDMVVWRDFRHGDGDVYARNLSSGLEVRITSAIGDQTPCDIHESIVVWEDERNGNPDICAYDLIEGQELFLTTDPSRQLSPAVWGDHVVWMDNRNGNWDIFIYDLESGEQRALTTGTEDERSPSIYENLVAWSAHRSGDIWDIFVCDLLTGQTRQITTDEEPLRNRPRLFGSFVVWDQGEGYKEVHCFDLETGDETRLS